MYLFVGSLTFLKAQARNRARVAALAAGSFTVLATTAAGQTTISTELTAPRDVDASVEFMGSLARRAAGGFEWYLSDLTLGVSPRLEVGASWSALVPGSAAEPHEILPHAKLVLFAGSTSAVAVGGAWHLPVSNRTESQSYGWFYAAASRTIETARPITISAGAYRLVRRDQALGETRNGVSLGWDQAISDRWSYSVEWISGANWYGYLSSGITISAGRGWLTGGYCIGNERGSNHGPCFSAGRSF